MIRKDSLIIVYISIFYFGNRMSEGLWMFKFYLVKEFSLEVNIYNWKVYCK